MKAAKRVHKNPLPLRQQVSESGVTLSPYLMRSVRRGIADINGGRYKTFTSAAEAIADLHKAAGLK